MSTAIAELPYIDPTSGMELTTGDEIALEATRWIWLGMDYLDPARRQQVKRLQRGGEELDNVCLRRTHGFLPRCSFTPLEVWAEWLPIEFFPEGARPLKLKGETTEDLNPNGRTLIGKPLFGYAHYPGEQIHDVVDDLSAEPRGVVEIEALRGVDFEDAGARKLQQLFFPGDAPLELRLVEQHIEQVAAANPAPEVQLAAEDMLRSCSQSRRWAEGVISKQHTQLDERVTHQYVHRYAPKVLSLMKQLEMQPRMYAASPVETMLKAMNNTGLTPDILTQMQERDSTMMEKFGEVLSGALAEAFKQLQPQPPKGNK